VPARAIAAAAAIALAIAGFGLGLFGGFGFGGALVPVAFLALAGLAVWWFVSGERPSGSPGDVLRRALLGFGLLLGCAALAVGSFLASGLGGGVVVAGLVVLFVVLHLIVGGGAQHGPGRHSLGQGAVSTVVDQGAPQRC
jgi:hypothetical protein